MLEFVAGQTLVLVSQVQVLLGIDEAPTAACLCSLAERGLVVMGPRLRHQAGCYQISRRGLEAIPSRLSEPPIELREYWREVARGWVWLAARAGRFEGVERVYSCREMQAVDEQRARARVEDGDVWSPALAAKVADASFGVPLDGDGPGEAGESHYPDVVLVMPQGRIAVELELEPTALDRLERIIAAYERKATVGGVLFLVESPALGRRVEIVVTTLGVSDRVLVQPLRLVRSSR